MRQQEEDAKESAEDDERKFPLLELTQQFLELFLIGHPSVSKAKAVVSILHCHGVIESIASGGDIVCPVESIGNGSRGPFKLTPDAIKAKESSLLRRLHQIGHVLTALKVVRKYNAQVSEKVKLIIAMR
jgi:hypothetical protein